MQRIVPTPWVWARNGSVVVSSDELVAHFFCKHWLKGVAAFRGHVSGLSRMFVLPGGSIDGLHLRMLGMRCNDSNVTTLTLNMQPPPKLGPRSKRQ